MFLFRSLNILLIISAKIGADQNGSCYVYDKDGAKHLGTKTPYRIIANKKDSIIKYKDCYPLKIIGVIRHGTRTPGHKVVHKIRVKLEELKDQIQITNQTVWNIGQFCEYDLHSGIKNWKLLLEKEGEKVLTREGEDEMIKLAKRFKNRFPSLLNQEYSNTSYYFRFTDTQRTRESAKFFTFGLFGNESSKIWFPEAIYKDPILRFYKLCDKWRQEIKKNPKSLEELNKFLQTGEMEDMLIRITKRIGLNYTISYEVVHVMYVTCSFETAWNGNIQSPWCSVFSKQDLKVLEYAEELKYYWRDGYGYDINHNQACPLISNIFSHFNSEDSPQSVFYFTHSGTILKTLSHLGLYKDEYKLTHNIHWNQRDNRKWKVSKVDPFSSNLIFVLYRCCEDDLKVLLLHQERIIKFPGCTESDLCSLKKLETLFYKSINDCDFQNMCSLK